MELVADKFLLYINANVMCGCFINIFTVTSNNTVM